MSDRLVKRGSTMMVAWTGAVLFGAAAAHAQDASHANWESRLHAAFALNPAAEAWMQDAGKRNIAHDVDDNLRDQSKTPILNLRYSYSSLTYSSLTSKDVTTGTRTKLNDQDWVNHQLRLSWGSPVVRGFVHIDNDSFGTKGAMLRHRDQLVATGFGGGFEGEPVLWQKSWFKVFVPFEAGYSVHDAVDERTGAATRTFTWDELTGRAGLGVAVDALRVSVSGIASRLTSSGVGAKAIAHAFDLGEGVALDGVQIADISGTSYAGAGSLEYSFNYVPVTLRVDGYIGDIEGFTASLAWRF